MDQPKTLVLNLSGTLVHTNYVFGKGVEVVMRPGLQKFLNYLAQMYEIVVFSDDDTMVHPRLPSIHAETCLSNSTP